MEAGHLEEAIVQLETILSDARDPVRAVQCEAYMKHHFPFFGMPAGERRALVKPWLATLKGIDNRSDRWELIRELWAKEEREFQYAAIDWLNSWPKRWYDAHDGDDLEWLITQKSWWDSVDSIADYVGKWHLLFPAEARKAFEEWRYAESFWLQRSCLIYQLKYKAAVDVAYLESLIVQLLPINEFFIQKAIGWSLRQLSKFRPEDVRRILAEHPVKGLALREAAKYL